MLIALSFVALQDLRRDFPHSTGMRQPLVVDYVSEYERATGHRLPREPRWAPARDPLYHLPQRQRARRDAVLAMWGSVADAWEDVVHNGGQARFVPSFRVYLDFR